MGPPPGGPGWSGPPPPGPKRSSTALIVVVALVLVVLVGGGATAGVVVLAKHSGGDDHSSSPSSVPTTGPGCEDDPGFFEGAPVLADLMTSAIQKHKLSALLALAASAQAKASLQSWWTNASTVGFTTGGVTASDANDDTTAHSVTVSIGLHHRFDATTRSTTSSKQVPDAPATQYRLGVEKVASGQGCRLGITSFTSLGHAPWDGATRLTAVRLPHAEVVGDASQHAVVARVAAQAEASVDWTRSFLRAAGRRVDVNTQGLLIFVPSTRAEQNTWFRTDAQQKKEGGLGGSDSYTFSLPGLELQPTFTPPPGVTVPKVKEIGFDAGGTRVLLTSGGQRLHGTSLGGLLVAMDANADYATSDTGRLLGKSGVNEAVVVGSGRLVETYYLLDPGSPSAAAHSTSQAVDLLGRSLTGHLGGFDGRYPTDAQLDAGGDYESALAASTFAYQAETTSLNFALQTINDCYLNGGGPFDGVVTKIHGGTITYGNARQQQGYWADWVRHRF